MTDEPDPDIKLSGYLERRGLFGIWARRWCVFVNGMLEIYKDENTFDPEVLINISECSVIKIENNEPRIYIKNDKDKKELYLRFKDYNTALKWVLSLRTCCYDSIKMSMDSFRVVSVIGRGHYGKVVLAKKLDSDDWFAIKSVHKKKLEDTNKVHTIISERNILLQAHNPFIVQLKYAFQTDSKFYLVLEYVSGGDLYTILQKNGPLPLDQARLMTAEIAIALNYVHNLGVVYRDLKSENVLIDSDGHVKLTDFGFAKDLGKEFVTKTFCGTSEYLAPELVNHASYGPAVDWWALGVLLFEMLFGRTPFYDENTSKMFAMILTAPPSFPEDADRSAADLIRGLLQKRERSRFGFKEVSLHPFFQGMDFGLVQQKEYVPSYRPIVRGPSDTANFDFRFTEEPIEESTASPREMVKVSGFSYGGSSESPN